MAFAVDLPIHREHPGPLVLDWQIQNKLSATVIYCSRALALFLLQHHQSNIIINFSFTDKRKHIGDHRFLDFFRRL